jgi:regulation of enolase protein 1 (concanavalin A-like superfamily)
MGHEMTSTRSPRTTMAWLLATVLFASLLVPVAATAASDDDWVSGDIGQVDPSGSFSTAGTEYVVRGSGRGLGGAADGLHYARQVIDGDAVVVAKVEALSAGSKVAHAGVMIREDDSPDSAHASLVVVAGQVALRYRDARGASTTQINYRPPRGWGSTFWLRMERKGSTYTAEISRNGRGWQEVSTVELALDETVLVGLVASNAENGQLATATFSGAAIEGSRSEIDAGSDPEPTPDPEPSDDPDPEPSDDPDPEPSDDPDPEPSDDPDPEPTPDPEPSDDPDPEPTPDPEPSDDPDPALVFTGQDIGSPTPDGSTVEDGGMFIIKGAGVDIWDRSDGFHYAWKEITGDVEILTRVTSQTNTHPWAKAGVMLRDGLAADARHASVFVTPSNGTALQHRPVAGGDSYHSPGPMSPAPYWVRIQRIGSTVIGAVSPDGSTWTEVGRLSLSLPDTLHVGLAVTSHNDGTLSTASFTDLDISPLEPVEESADDPVEEPVDDPVDEPSETLPGDRLGLHVTTEELTYWKQRWTGATGDAFLDSRIGDEKTRVTNNKNTFMNDPSGHLWGYSLPVGSDGCINSDLDHSTQRARSARMRDAAFFGLVTEDPVVLNQVKSTLVLQPRQRGVNFGDEKPWCPMIQSMVDAAAPYFATTHAVITSLFTYDYLQVAIDRGLIADFTPAQKAELDKWYRDWAYKLSPSAHFKMRGAFKDWDNDDYTLAGGFADPNNWISWTSPNTYQGGPKVHSLHNLFNNRRASTVRYIAVAGVKFDDDYLQWFAKKWFQDFLRYHTYPHGALGDMHRGWTNASSGLGYMSMSTAHVLTGVDTFARAGDTRLYDLSTTVGAHGTQGTPHHGELDGKSYRFVMQTLTRYSDGQFHRLNGNGQRYDFGAPNIGYHDRLLVGNLYYRDGKVTDFYRGQNGMHPWRVTGNGTSDLNDAWAYPAPYLMWAGLEGKVWPYPEGDE